MPRKANILQNTFPYHLINKTIDPEFFGVPLEELWAYGASLLNIVNKKYGLQTHAYVLMGNHFHLLASTPDSNIDRCMQFFQSRLALFISKHRTKSSIRFKGRFRASMIQNSAHFNTVLSYIYLNPVRAQLSDNPEDYPFSTLFELTKFGHSKINLFSHELGQEIFEMSPEFLAKHIKSSPAVEFSNVIARALKEPVYKTS